MMVELSGVCKRIGRREVLTDVSVEAPRGVVTGFAGVNGSGKTMAMRVLAGLVRPGTGEVRVNGVPLRYGAAFPVSIGLLIEHPAFLERQSGLDNLLTLASIRQRVGVRAVRDAIGAVGLDADDRRTVRAYSLGMRQRLGIAMALMEHPEVVVLDEPFNALDEDGCACVEELIAAEARRGAAVILACHDAERLRRLAQRTYRFSEGRVIGCAS